MCEFCDGRKKKIENGYTYGRAYIESTNYGYYHRLCYDNSGEEYREGEFEINYCPICGRKLEPSEDDVSAENKKKFVQIMRQLTAKRKE